MTMTISSENVHDRPRLRIFLAGATGIIGIRLLPLLIAEHHTVAGMTRSPEKIDQLRALGAEPIICDVFDSVLLTKAVTTFQPDAVIHQLTDLPDDVDQLPDFGARNDRIRTEGTHNLIAAAKAAGVRHLLAQSIAWRPPGRAEIVDQHERQVLDARGVVVRYGRLYGPGTFYQDQLPPPPRIHVDHAAQATPPLLHAPAGVVVLTEEPRSD
jgi:NAD(P)H-binding